MYYLGAIPSLAVICRSRNVGVWAEFKRRLVRSRSFHLPSTVPHVDLPEHLSYLL